MTERMQLVIEYIDKLKEAIELEARLFGDANILPMIPKEPGKSKKGGARVPIDKGKLFALKRAKWSNADIASDLGCSEKTVAEIIRTEREAAQDEGRAPAV